MTFKPRLTAPSTTDKHWIQRDKGGYNPCILIKGNSVLPNCVGYAWGRFMEVLGKAPTLSRANAENWWDYNDGYERGQTPRLGAVICWRKGKAHESTDGAGHVAIVEKIAPDGTITTSNSAYGGSRFYMRELKPPDYYMGSKFTFQGFIYNPAVEDKEKFNMTYETGIYKVTASGLRVRNKPGVDGKAVGSVEKGQTVEIAALHMDDKQGTWGSTSKDRWICLEQPSGEKYAERIGDLPDDTEKIRELEREIDELKDTMTRARAKIDDASEMLEV